MTHLGQWLVVDCKIPNCHWMPKVSSDKVTLRLLKEHQSQHLEKLGGVRPSYPDIDKFLLAIVVDGENTWAHEHQVKYNELIASQGNAASHGREAADGGLGATAGGLGAGGAEGAEGDDMNVNPAGLSLSRTNNNGYAQATNSSQTKKRTRKPTVKIAASTISASTSTSTKHMMTPSPQKAAPKATRTKKNVTKTEPPKMKPLVQGGEEVD
ncbi:hypothetical protein B0J14DRAFT_648819 [Halenospora varia]|nr:hypothetical protein B0J14DRAFT_648819 [Halenospora varia]